MNKTALRTAAVTGLAALVGTSGFVAAADAKKDPKPYVRDLDAELVSGNQLKFTVEGSRAATVRMTYRGTTRTARMIPDDDNDRERDYVARFRPASGDRDGARVSVKVTIKRGSASVTRTLRDRIDDEREDERDDD